MDANLVRTNRPGLKKLLGDQEADIMEQVWAIGGSVLAKQVHERMRGGEKLAYSTVVCTMTRLANKNLLHIIDSTTKPYRYEAILSREQFVGSAIQHVLGSLAQDFPVEVACFLQERSNVSDQIKQTLSGLED
ncbi:MAG: BlaI/MecI/CopY family transcriptional regulator [Anaerolineae bacterium]|nr:BlaI/MecI/CopY family transcriptional regulator [Gloeobacterales cyanobacterium ES-bin-313]